MLQVKIFERMYADELELNINNWIKSYPEYEILNINISVMDNGFYYCIIQYKKGD